MGSFSLFRHSLLSQNLRRFADFIGFIVVFHVNVHHRKPLVCLYPGWCDNIRPFPLWRRCGRRWSDRRGRGWSRSRRRGRCRRWWWGRWRRTRGPLEIFRVPGLFQLYRIHAHTWKFPGSLEISRAWKNPGPLEIFRVPGNFQLSW